MGDTEEKCSKRHRGQGHGSFGKRAQRVDAGSSSRNMLKSVTGAVEQQCINICIRKQRSMQPKTAKNSKRSGRHKQQQWQQEQQVKEQGQTRCKQQSESNYDEQRHPSQHRQKHADDGNKTANINKGNIHAQPRDPQDCAEVIPARMERRW